MKILVNWKQIDKFSQTMFTSDIPTVGKHMRIVELSRSSRCQAILFYTRSGNLSYTQLVYLALQQT